MVMELGEMKKILYFITTSEWGGASQYVYNLCKYEKARGNKVYLVVGSIGKLSNEIQKLGIKVFIVKEVRKNISPLNDIISIFKIQKLIRKINPDIVHLNSSKAGVIGRIACRNIKNKNMKVVFTVHGWSFTDGIPSNFKKFLFRWIERLVSRFTDLFICVSNYDAKIGRRDKVLNSKSNVVVIHNGTLPPQQKAEINHAVHTPIRLVMIARFSKQKRQEQLIKALGQIDKKLFHLTFVGDGETLDECKQLVNELNLSKNITFVGFKDNVAPYLIKNDVYILTSFYEGLPLGIIEAMSFGLPIIASNVGGNSELVTNNINGYLVNNTHELIKSILLLIHDQNKIEVMGQKSYSIFLDGLTLKKNMNEVNSAYKSLFEE